MVTYRSDRPADVGTNTEARRLHTDHGSLSATAAARGEVGIEGVDGRSKIARRLQVHKTLRVGRL